MGDARRPENERIDERREGRAAPVAGATGVQGDTHAAGDPTAAGPGVNVYTADETAARTPVAGEPVADPADPSTKRNAEVYERPERSGFPVGAIVAIVVLILLALLLFA